MIELLVFIGFLALAGVVLSFILSVLATLITLPFKIAFGLTKFALGILVGLPLLILTVILGALFLPLLLIVLPFLLILALFVGFLKLVF